MPRYTPGPIAIEALPLPPRVVEPDTFQRIGQSLVAAHRAFDDVVGQRLAQASTLADVNLDPEFWSSVGPALDGLSSLGASGDKYSPVDIVRAIDFATSEIDAVSGDLPDPFEPDPGVDLGPPDVPPPGGGHDLTPPPPTGGGGGGAPPPDGGGGKIPVDPVGPDEVQRLAVEAIAKLIGHPPDDALLQALANDAGYVQGTTVSRAWLLAYLGSDRARRVAGL